MADHNPQFYSLDERAQFLEAHRPLWEERPFVGVPVSWESRWPELSRGLRALPELEISVAEGDPLAFLASQKGCAQLYRQLVAHSSWPSIDSQSASVLKSGQSPDSFEDNEPLRPPRIEKRKWSQIVQFVACISAQAPTGVNQWVDWCAGKGHLGRTINKQLQQPVTCVEINEKLVQKGADETEAIPSISFEQGDVRFTPLAHLFHQKSGVVALHACGDLNARLLELAANYSPAFLAIVPCCYQRIEGTQFRPLSAAARETGFQLTRHQLRLPALDEVNASEKKSLFRKREAAFRQGTDLLIRQATGRDAYTPLGKIPPHVIRGDFESFARFAAKKVRVSLPLTVRWAAAETAGFQQLQLVRSLSVARQLFRRAIESWLFLDRIVFLEQNGYHVTAGTFCPRSVTPRNLMMLASKR